MKKLMLGVMVSILLAGAFFVLKELDLGNQCPEGEISIGNGQCRGTGVIPEGSK